MQLLPFPWFRAVETITANGSCCKMSKGETQSRQLRYNIAKAAAWRSVIGNKARGTPAVWELKSLYANIPGSQGQRWNVLISISKCISSKAKQKQYVQRVGNHLHSLQSFSMLRNFSANWQRAGLPTLLLETNWLLRWISKTKPNSACPWSGKWAVPWLELLQELPLVWPLLQLNCRLPSCKRCSQDAWTNHSLAYLGSRLCM